MAAGAFRELLASLPETTIRAYTDGGCKGNPGPAGSGARVELPDGQVGEACESLGRGTNNIAELAAVGLAMDLLESKDVDQQTAVALFSDSSYTNGVLVKNWKAKKNTELIMGLRERLKAWPNLTIYWVAGHVGVAGNERADRLADAGIQGRSEHNWS
jgi:ribonuclease HI